MNSYFKSTIETKNLSNSHLRNFDCANSVKNPEINGIINSENDKFF